ncbi:hypothetical protein ACWCXB_34735 [Streptomyces sp. NPDC001514]
MTKRLADFAVDNGTVDVEQAQRHLHDGRAVVLPNPAPLTCVVAATQSHAVNRALGRSLSFPTTLWVHHPRTRAELRAMLALTARGRRVLDSLLAAESVILSVPVSPRQAEWIAPAVKDGRVHVFGACWQVLSPVIAPFPVLFMDHAKRGGHPAAGCAADAIKMFPLSVPVLGTAALDVEPHELGIPGEGLGQRVRPVTMCLNPMGQARLQFPGSRSTRWLDPQEVLDSIHGLRPIPGDPHRLP